MALEPPPPTDDFLAQMFKTRDSELLRTAYGNLLRVIKDTYGRDVPPDLMVFLESLANDPLDRDAIHFGFLVATLFVRDFRDYVVAHHRGNASVFLNHLSTVYYTFLDQSCDAEGKALYPNYTHVLGEMRTFYLGNIAFG